MKNVYPKVFLLAGTAMGITLTTCAQTNNCNNNAAGQLTVGATCNPVSFGTVDNVNWWTDSWYYGNCEEFYGDAWMWFDATSTSTTITYDPVSLDAVLTIFQGTCNANGPSVACADWGGLGVPETITMTTTPGARYHIRIENYNGNADMAGTICVYSPSGSGVTTASDCSVATNICTNLSFVIDPNGHGAVNEIPVWGSYGNPFANPASLNEGCLQDGEYNSTWMVINVATTVRSNSFSVDTVRRAVISTGSCILITVLRPVRELCPIR